MHVKKAYPKRRTLVLHAFFSFFYGSHFMLYVRWRVFPLVCIIFPPHPYFPRHTRPSPSASPFQYPVSYILFLPSCISSLLPYTLLKPPVTSPYTSTTLQSLPIPLCCCFVKVFSGSPSTLTSLKPCVCACPPTSITLTPSPGSHSSSGKLTDAATRIL